MKFEPIKTISFHEYNEKLFYGTLQDESKELSRRNMLKYLVIGGAGLLVPSYLLADTKSAICRAIPDPRAKAICYIAIESLEIARFAWEIYEMIEGTIALLNPSKVMAKSNINFKLFNDSGVSSSDSAKYKIPPDSFKIYSYGIDGAEKVGGYSLLAKNHDSSKELTGIKVSSKISNHQA